MGRQAYLTFLALGRSSFSDLLRDEHGNVVVGPHSQDNTASGYVQAFDYKGRPTNEEAERANRRLFRAQNEVLRVAGVVRKKGDDGPAAPNQFDGLDDEDKIKLIIHECNVGANLGYFTGIFCQISDWWLESWRSRVFVFKSHLEPPLLSTLAIERRAYGLLPFLFSGLPWAMCAGTVNLFRHWTLYPSLPFRLLSQSPRSRYENQATTLRFLAQRYLFDLLLFSIEWPLRVFATLQSMHLIPLSAMPSWRSFIPWMADSPTQLANVIGRIMAGDFMGTLIALQSNPLLLAYISDLIREWLTSGFHIVLSNCLPQPNEPDPLSREAVSRWYSDAEPPFGKDRLIGVRLGIDPLYSQISSNDFVHSFRRQYKGPQKVQAALRSAFPALFQFVGQFIELDPLSEIALDRDLFARLSAGCARRYLQLKRLHHHIPEVTDQQIREEASLQAFDRLGLDMIDLGIDVEWWTSETMLPDYDSFSPTPETLSVIEGLSELAGPVRSSHSNAGQEVRAGLGGEIHDSIDEQQAPTAQLPVPGLDQPEETTDETAREAAEGEAAENLASSNHEPNPTPLHEAEAERTRPGTPTGQIHESIEGGGTADIAPDASSPTARLPPGVRVRRRPTELDDETDDIAGELGSNLLNPTATNLQGFQTYRVTHLSLMSTEVLSIFTSSIITSVLMLPIDIYLTRLLGRGFALANPAGSGSSILWNLWPVSPWAAAREMGIRGNLGFVSRVFWSLGVQGIMAATMSAGLAALARWSGPRWFGWGRFPPSVKPDTLD